MGLCELSASWTSESGWGRWMCSRSERMSRRELPNAPVRSGEGDLVAAVLLMKARPVSTAALWQPKASGGLTQPVGCSRVTAVSPATTRGRAGNAIAGSDSAPLAAGKRPARSLARGSRRRRSLGAGRAHSSAARRCRKRNRCRRGRALVIALRRSLLGELGERSGVEESGRGREHSAKLQPRAAGRATGAALLQQSLLPRRAPSSVACAVSSRESAARRGRLEDVESCAATAWRGAVGWLPGVTRPC